MAQNTTTLNYEALGFKAGLEIHAQLEGKKLFCDCPTCIREDKADFEVERKLKAVVGETGVIDAAASKEQAKNKSFVYQGYSDTTCLVEIDEEPPHLMNEGALNLGLQICKRFQTRVVDEIQVMRKTVVDGSNTSGFQRTSLLGMNGQIDVDDKKIGIQTVCLEEDACKIVSRESEKDTYNLSRLGIPLIEIATDPDMKTPGEVKSVAEKIGMYLRSLSPFKGQSIKRGLGTIRQDVNVSISEGNRIEIKGAQDLRMIPTLVDYEIMRQQKIVELKKKIQNKELIVKDVAESDIVDVTSILKNTDCKFVKATIDSKGVVFGIKISGFNGVLGQEVMPGRRVGSEVSDYAKMSGVGGMIHSDENLSKYKFREDEIISLKSTLKVEENDAFILVADKKEKVIQALLYAGERIKRLDEGVIKEVRKANADGTTTYMRPMPGGARMYPETDTLPITPHMMKVVLGKTIEERIVEYQELGIKDKDIAATIAKEFSDVFEALKNKVATDVHSLASNIVSGSTVLENITAEILEPIFTAMNEGKVPKNSYLEILESVKSGQSVKDAIASKQSMPREDVEKIVDAVLQKLGDVDLSKMGLIMGEVMKESKGKADGKVASEIIRSKLK